MKIQDYLKKKKLLTDGSFGTYYAEKYNTQELPERANTKNPERVIEIHKEYIESGASLVRTNTFASNTVQLKESMESVLENIDIAVKLAREACEGIDRNIYIAGDIGPIPFSMGITIEELEKEYELICRQFIKNGINILNFETFPDLEYIANVIKKIKKENDVFISVEFCINQFGYSNSGLSVNSLFAEAENNIGIDAYGLNCGIGPAHMLKYIKNRPQQSKKYLMCLPNAGYPQRVRNNLMFSNSPEYFAEKISEIAENGASIIGGCCGTNPGYISETFHRISFQNNLVVNEGSRSKNPIKQEPQQGFIYDEKGNLKNKKLIAVELAPPLNANDEKIMEAANLLIQENVDVVTFPDSPSGRTRADAILMAEKVKRETGLRVMPHICCRDKNAIAIRAQLLGAVINGINDFLVITGDPIPTLMRETVKSVFQFDSVGMMKLFKDLEKDQLGEDVFCFGGAINQGRMNISSEIKRVKRKMDAGAKFFLTQPVFSDTDIENIKRIKEETEARILCGIMPLISKRNALFMKNEIVGINVPDEIIDLYSDEATKKENESVAVSVSVETIKRTWDICDGYYFSFPFNRVYLLREIKEKLVEYSLG